MEAGGQTDRVQIWEQKDRRWTDRQGTDMRAERQVRSRIREGLVGHSRDWLLFWVRMEAVGLILAEEWHDLTHVLTRALWPWGEGRPWWVRWKLGEQLEVLQPPRHEVMVAWSRKEAPQPFTPLVGFSFNPCRLRGGGDLEYTLETRGVWLMGAVWQALLSGIREQMKNKSLWVPWRKEANNCGPRMTVRTRLDFLSLSSSPYVLLLHTNSISR